MAYFARDVLLGVLCPHLIGLSSFCIYAHVNEFSDGITPRSYIERIVFYECHY